MGIVGGLLIGWFLSLFGFMGLVQDGAKNLFDITINGSGYYLIFAIMGYIKSVRIGEKLIKLETKNEKASKLK